MSRILLVDDELMNRQVASKILKKEGFEVIMAENGKQAIELLENPPDGKQFDLILMDLMMPVMDGFEATEIIKRQASYQTIPLIIISALSDKTSILKGLKLGADEYLTKPFDIVEFTLRISNAIKIGRYQHMLIDQQAVLEQMVAEKSAQLQQALAEVQKSEKDILSILDKTAEYRDNETSEHTVRVGEMSAFIARELGWDEQQAELIRLAAPLHDIGKVGIPDNILLKPGRLDDQEFAIMKQHAQIGHEILSQKQTPILKMAAEIAFTHHEKYNGMGYPRGLAKDDIPQSGAIVAVVDVFDALLSSRPYKKAFSLAQTVDIIQQDRGQHFHPQICDCLLKNVSKLTAIRDNIDHA